MADAINKRLEGGNEAYFNTPKEFGDIPKGFVSVFIVANKSSLRHISEFGFRVSDNRMADKSGDLEKLFSESPSKKSVATKRTQCIFAYPRHPEMLRDAVVSFDPTTDVLIEAKIDPESAVVVDGADYTEAAARFHEKNLESVQSWVEHYWNNSKKFKDYLVDSNTLDTDCFISPEVLINEDIPANRIRVLK